MRDCYGLVDSFVWIIKAPIGKTDIDNKVTKEEGNIVLQYPNTLGDAQSLEHFITELTGNQYQNNCC